VSPLKRAVDVAIGAAGLWATAPLFAGVAIAIRVTDGGSVFFRQERVGRHGKPFKMLKFRTMVVDAERRGASITVGQDPRITTVGRWLRASKLDELPQLLNVLAGEMTLVGPRPEVPRYVAMYDEAQREVLKLTPGVTDKASIRYRNESELLAGADDPEKFYVDVVMPDKIRINLEYARRATALSDLAVVAETVLAIVRDRFAQSR
jgi:lipopolysaccharide/colanic/teichoic acid biosynthesis glycosyltransferase